MKNKKRIKKEKTAEEQKVKQLIWITILLVLAIVLFLGLIDAAGPLGQYLALAVKFVFGWSGWLVPVIFIFLSYAIFRLRPEKKVKTGVWFGLILLIIFGAGIFHLYLIQDGLALQEQRGGGYFGYAVAWLLNQIFGFWGSLIVLVAIFCLSLISISTEFIVERLPAEAEKEAIVSKEPAAPSFWQKLKKRWQKKKELVLRPEKMPAKLITKSAEELTKSQKAEIVRPILKTRSLAARIDLPLDLLEAISTKPNSGDVKANKLTIQKTLENFGIPVEMGEIKTGPTVTQYTLKPADGVKLSQIVKLHNDLALALAAHPIRIEAPIPGQSLVGIEVPNQQVAVVRLREVLENEEFKKRKTNLTIALGKDVAGNIWFADLAKMPHLMVAGATGSGKTVMLNSIIISLLYQNSPDDLKFILVDPKRVELPLYNDLPHLLTPVITDVQKTVNALKWALTEMERRFDLMSEYKKRDIESFNRETEEKLPYIIIVIDELADLMVAAPQEIETCIIRLAQMARATGIHLVLATQRPSVDIITGLIKANITTRIAFAVASMTDSRTILDFSGAEKLLGRGDMLFVSPELSKPKRLQGAYVSDREIKRIAEYLRNIKGPAYQDEILEKHYQSEDLGELADDELLPQAREVVIQASRGSASLLQRRLRVGYARAARLLDLLEEEGTIGPADGAKPREVLKREPEN